MNDFVGKILQTKFHAWCYILLSGTRPKRRCTPIQLRRCYATLGVGAAETSQLLTAYCIE